MIKYPRWHQGIPPVEAVKDHEEYHPRPDARRRMQITVGFSTGDEDHPFRFEEIQADDLCYGEWIAVHPGGTFQSHISFNRLKVVDGRVLYAIGFTQWGVLEETTWAAACRWFPVGPDGLPADYKIQTNWERARMRPAKYSTLSPEEQWVIDKELGLLDWDGR